MNEVNVVMGVVCVMLIVGVSGILLGVLIVIKNILNLMCD